MDAHGKPLPPNDPQFEVQWVPHADGTEYDNTWEPISVLMSSGSAQLKEYIADHQDTLTEAGAKRKKASSASGSAKTVTKGS